MDSLLSGGGFKSLIGGFNSTPKWFQIRLSGSPPPKVGSSDSGVVSNPVQVVSPLPQNGFIGLRGGFTSVISGFTAAPKWSQFLVGGFASGLRWFQSYHRWFQILKPLASTWHPPNRPIIPSLFFRLKPPLSNAFISGTSSLPHCFRLYYSAKKAICRNVSRSSES